LLAYFPEHHSLLAPNAPYQSISTHIGDGDNVAVRLKAFEVAGKKCFDLLPRQRTELKLLDDQSGRTNIIGAIEAPVPSADECLRLLRQALSARATAVHARNDESSRSHCVCVLDLLAVGGSLILVDCAGTERRQDTDQHSHERMKESSEINSSLHVLKECIRHRCKQQHAAQQAAKTGTGGHDEDEQQHVHVPYRDSQLTRVLHESFTRSGSYLAAIGTVSPSSLDAEHTMSTLKTLQLLMSESGQSDAPNFDQRIDLDPKTLLKSSSVAKRGFLASDRSRMSPLRSSARAPGKDANGSDAQLPASQHRSKQLSEATEGAGDRASGRNTPATSVPAETPSPPQQLRGAETEIAVAGEGAEAAEDPESPPQARQPRLQYAWCNEPQDPCPSQQDSPQPRVMRRPPAECQSVEVSPKQEHAMQQEIFRLQQQVHQLEESLREARASGSQPPEAIGELHDMQERAERAERRAEELEGRSLQAERLAEELDLKHLSAERRVDELETLFKDEQEQRRRVHNQLLDMKGQIRVFCRVRPQLPHEQGDEPSAVRRDSFTVDICKYMTSLEGMQRSERKAFPFDAVFGPSAQQEEVFKEVQDLVQSAIDGYNVTLFAYGQTGAGKTYTMYGGQGEQQGIAGRTIEAIFNIVARDTAKYDITIQASMVELYMTNLRDLCSGELIELRSNREADGTASVRLEGATQIPVQNREELAQVVAMGLQNRATRCTNMNADSSRSHLLLLITIEVADRSSGRTWSGKITIVDLAGSERIGKSGATGDCQKEAIEINRGLTALGDVIESLTRAPAGRPPVSVPYRNHKLTQLLCDSLGGSAAKFGASFKCKKTTMTVV